MTIHAPFATGLLAAALLNALAVPAARAQEHIHMERAAYQDAWIKSTPADPSEEWSTAYGGRLYDQWAEILDQNLPARTHLSYPRTAAEKGANTWRCVTCHGWDYRGAEGAFASGPQATGIKGITGMAGAAPEAIVAILRNPTHRYTPDLIPDDAARRLGLFVSKGQIDTTRLIDPATAAFKGDAGRGKAMFQNLCATCHGYDGKAQNFGSTAAPEFVGTVAVKDPWRLLHKVRNGRPGEAMPANIWMEPDVLANLGAYAQTLDVK
ncbi:MAG TPA: c-type cytochrome [Azospirillum sp.]|nr:c-type cytochrome [Azospirillum sp.]